MQHAFIANLVSATAIYSLGVVRAANPAVIIEANDVKKKKLKFILKHD